MSSSFRTPYPGYDVLGKWDTPSFNEPSRHVLTQRLDRVPERRFFDEAQWTTLEALCDRVIPQPERVNKVPIAPWIDADLHDGRGSGTRYADMPEAGAAWTQALAALDAEAHQRHGTRFAALGADLQDEILRAVNAGEVADEAAWRGLPPQRFFRNLALQQIVKIYYVHPQAMSEIGHGGPASPRGYVRLGSDVVDSWEAPPGQWRRGG